MKELSATTLHHLLREALSQEVTYIEVSSNSMAPLFVMGDLAGVVKATAETVQVGDIVIITDDHGFMMHRYWGYVERGSGRKIVTRGDITYHFDPFSTPSDVIGKVVARKRDTQLLSLETGRGRWLNRHLSFLSALKLRLSYGYAPNPLTNKRFHAPPPTVECTYKRNPRKGLARIFFTAVYRWSVYITTFLT